MKYPVRVSKQKAIQPDFLLIAPDGTVEGGRMNLSDAAAAVAQQPEGTTIAAIVAVDPWPDGYGRGADLDVRPNGHGGLRG